MSGSVYDRFHEARALSEGRPALLERINEMTAQAIGYVWGWQDAGGERIDSDRASTFGWAYGTVTALMEAHRISSRPAIQDAWKSWREHGEIRDYNGRALDWVPAVEPAPAPVGEPLTYTPGPGSIAGRLTGVTVWTPQTGWVDTAMACHQCGAPMFIEVDTEVSHHGQPGEIDFDADGDHAPTPRPESCP